MATWPTTEDIKEYTRNEKPTEDDAAYGQALAAAMQTLKDACQRDFTVATGVPSARTFVPDVYSTILHIGDCVSVSSVVENGTTLAASLYQLEPVTSVSPAGITTPKHSIRRLDSVWFTNNGRGTVVVTADWGFTALPPRILEACTILTKDIIENRDVKFGLVDISEAGGIAARMNPVVRSTITAYRGVKSWGIA